MSTYLGYLTLIDVKQRLIAEKPKESRHFIYKIKRVMKTICKILSLLATLIFVWNADGMFEILRTKLILGLIILLIGYLIYGKNFMKSENPY